MSGKRRTRLFAVLGATVAAVVVWLVAKMADVAVVAPTGAGGELQDIPVVAVIVTAVFASLAGWALLAILEKFTGKARWIWLGVAAVVFLLSLFGPVTAAGVEGSTKATLLLMHAAVAAVLIPVLTRTSQESVRAS
jgi:hypothetical protein